jgi:hypothetical protein
VVIVSVPGPPVSDQQVGLPADWLVKEELITLVAGTAAWADVAPVSEVVVTRPAATSAVTLMIVLVRMTPSGSGEARTVRGPDAAYLSIGIAPYRMSRPPDST